MTEQTHNPQRDLAHQVACLIEQHERELDTVAAVRDALAMAAIRQTHAGNYTRAFTYADASEALAGLEVA